MGNLPIFQSRDGFTLVELIVSIGIFALMTSLIVAKYGNFNQSVLLTNLAYDVALTIRTAQTYGLSVKSSGGSDPFQNAYGAYFSRAAGAPSQTIVLFADYDADNQYGGTGEDVNVYAIKRGAKVFWVCAGDDEDSCDNAGENALHITFKRPEPNANICLDSVCGKKYAEITVQAPDGNQRVISVRENGQISVKN